MSAVRDIVRATSRGCVTHGSLTRGCVLAGVLASTGVLAWPATVFAQPVGRCAPTTVEATEAVSGGRWGASVADLRVALSGAGHPWSCSGARVAVEPVGGGGVRVAVVMPDGRRAVRRVGAVGDLLATVEAVLIPGDTVDPSAPARRESVVTAVTDPTNTTSLEDPGPSGARVRYDVGLDGGMRVAGPTSAVMLSAGIRAGVIAGHGVFGAWGRYDVVMAGFATRSMDLDVAVLNVGLSAAWAFRVGAGGIEAGPMFSLAGVVENLHVSHTQRADTVIEPRLGAAVRWRSSTRGLGFTVTLDADAAPGSIGSGVDPLLPAPPAWSVGASVGAAMGGPL